MLEEIEDLLVASDMGVNTALRVTANLAEGRMGRRLSVPEIKGCSRPRSRGSWRASPSHAPLP
jgi:signal recognition particle GTPase